MYSIEQDEIKEGMHFKINVSRAIKFGHFSYQDSCSTTWHFTSNMSSDGFESSIFLSFLIENNEHIKYQKDWNCSVTHEVSHPNHR